MLSWIDRNGQAHNVTNLGQNVCNLKNPVWQVDSGLIENKDLLPIKSIKYGGLEFEAQKAIIKIGGLKCQGNIEEVPIKGIAGPKGDRGAIGQKGK